MHENVRILKYLIYFTVCHQKSLYTLIKGKRNAILIKKLLLNLLIIINIFSKNK